MLSRDLMKHTTEALEWFKEDWNSTAQMLINVLKGMSDKDNDKETKSFLTIFEKFIEDRQIVAKKHPDKVEPEFAQKANLLATLLPEIKRALAHTLNKKAA